MAPDPPTGRSWCDRLARPYLKRSSGAVVGIVTEREPVFEAYGRIDGARSDRPDPHTYFEIGSITKLFTSLLLARLTALGRLDPDAPLGVLCPRFAGTPEWITPRSLATHTSGLPRIPMPLWRVLLSSPVDPYATFDGAALEEWVAQWRPRRAPLPFPRYSNLGVGLLGYALGLVAGADYASTLTREVLEPLSLDEVTLELTPSQESRLATPHRANGRPTPPWSFSALAGAGALRATPTGLARFCRQVMDGAAGQGPLAEAIGSTLEVQVPGVRGAPDQCMGWMRFTGARLDTPVYHHDGGTLGSSATLYVVPRAGFSAFVLSNCGLSTLQMIRIARSHPRSLIDEAVASRTVGG